MKNAVNESVLPGMKALERMVGTWKISGGANGEATFEWMEGGFFLMQHGLIEQNGVMHKALEIIGCEKPFGADKPNETITSRSYTDSGDTLDYTYEMDGDTLTIWGGPKGSPAFSRATFSEDGNTLSGAWEWPGGYNFVMTRIK
ncbi:hypothetical protein [Oceanobacillus sp. CFH 90083]|uniref:hypothetical protein n=1 Tax=Oceanobacillus sp. CFH 90083 TaxID=2592336 RepID=UPI00128E0CAF|nr:hypothetical protein [Oceanobacillus sp. CFH 90083]